MSLNIAYSPGHHKALILKLLPYIHNYFSQNTPKCYGSFKKYSDCPLNSSELKGKVKCPYIDSRSTVHLDLTLQTFY